MNENKDKVKDNTTIYIDSISREERGNLWNILSKVALLAIFAIVTLLFLVIYVKKNFELPDEALVLPKSLEDAKTLSTFFIEYSNENMKKLIFVYSYIYIWKSSFGLPGSIIMNILGGALFGEVGIIMVVLLSSIGASICYFISKLCLGSLLNYYAKDKIKSLEIKIKQNEGNLFFYLLFIRLFPITPNWFVNIASPLLKIKFFPHFFLTNLLGLLSYNIFSTQAGFILLSLNSTKDIFNAGFFAKIIPISILALIPPLFGSKIKNYFNKEKEK